MRYSEFKKEIEKRMQFTIYQISKMYPLTFESVPDSWDNFILHEYKKMLLTQKQGFISDLTNYIDWMILDIDDISEEYFSDWEKYLKEVKEA